MFKFKYVKVVLYIVYLTNDFNWQKRNFMFKCVQALEVPGRMLNEMHWGVVMRLILYNHTDNGRDLHVHQAW